MRHRQYNDGDRLPIPVNASDLIYGRRVESARIEYKKGWNPAKVLHTMCAFANDVEGWGGGYIIIGVDFGSGRPEIVGIDENTVDSINRELIGMGNLMEPRYIPIADLEHVDGKDVFLIWVPAGDRRPYSCPISYSRERKSGERAYYIRRLASTIRVDRDDERMLFEASRNNPFDECINPDARIDDLRPSLIRDYLYRVGSDLYRKATDEPIERLADLMRIAGGPPEDRRPLNVGMMFFNDEPERFLPGAYVEVVHKPKPSGEGMSVWRFTGPVDRQIIESIRFLENTFVTERVYKTNDPQSRRVLSYPPKAIRELLVNAVYHKSYEMREPVVVTVTPECMEFLNYPGPSPSITDEDIRNNRLNVSAYRNRRTGEYLKELELAEARFTGIPLVIESLERNGSPPLRILTDPLRTYFKAVLGIHPDFLEQAKYNNDSPIEDRIASVLRSSGCLSLREISQSLGYKGINKTVSEAVKGMISEGRLEYLIPDKPRSPKQRICLRR